MVFNPHGIEPTFGVYSYYNLQCIRLDKRKNVRKKIVLSIQKTFNAIFINGFNPGLGSIPRPIFKFIAYTSNRYNIYEGPWNLFLILIPKRLIFLFVIVITSRSKSCIFFLDLDFLFTVLNLKNIISEIDIKIWLKTSWIYFTLLKIMNFSFMILKDKNVKNYIKCKSLFFFT